MYNKIRSSVSQLFSGSQNEVEERDVIHGNRTIFDYFMSSNAKVTEEEAMQIPAVSASIDLISSSIARLPINLFRTSPKGEVERVRVDENKRLYTLNHEANETMNSYNFKKQIVRDYLFHGSAYIKIDRHRNEILGLYPLEHEKLMIKKHIHKQDGYRQTATYHYSTETGEKVFNSDEVIVILKDSEDGIKSKGVLENNANVLRMALNEIRYSSNILENGALPIGVLSTPTRLNPDAMKRLRENWNDLYQGAKNSGRTVVLEGGLEYKSVSLKPNELELTKAKKSTMSDIARIFNIPESMINADANKYASNEQNNIHFLQYCVSPVITSFESAINKSLLMEYEKRNGYYFKFDTSQILRSTEKEKIEAVEIGWDGGLYTLNESRAKLELKSVENGDFLRGGLGDTFIDIHTGDITIANLGVTINPRKDALETSEMQKLKGLVEQMDKLEILQKFEDGEFNDEDLDSLAELISQIHPDITNKRKPKNQDEGGDKSEG